MAYTEAQWSNLQRQLPVEDRMSYGEYVATLSPEEQRQIYLASLTPAERRKILEAGPSAVTTVDERTKLAGAKTDTAAQATATATAAQQEATRAALAALTSGRTLTDAQKALLDIGTKTTATTLGTLTAEEAQTAVRKLTAGDPLTDAEKAFLDMDGNDNVDGNNNAGGDSYTTVDGVLMFNGSPFSGTYNGQEYENGKVKLTPPPGGDDYTTVDGVLMFKGAPFTGSYNGKEYENGKVKVTPPGGDEYTTVDGVLMYKGAAFTGMYQGKEYVNGKVKTTPPPGGNDYTTVDGVLMYKGAPFSGNYNGKEYVNGKVKTGGGLKNPGYWTDPTTGLLYKDDVLFDGTLGTLNYKGGRVTGGNNNQGDNNAALAEKIAADAKKSAQEEFLASLTELGLGDLAKVINDMIKLDFAVSKIKMELPKTQEYKDRFPGMAALRDAGQAVSEATYISMEKGYLQTLQAYGLDTKTLGSRAQLGTYISNLVSPREFEERVNLAATRVKENADVISQFKAYYPEVDNSALTAYLLNPKVGMDIIKKQVRTAEIGAAAKSAGFAELASQTGIGTAGNLIDAVGTSDYGTLKKQFGEAKTLATQQERLSRIEGQQYSEIEAVNAAVAQNQGAILASRRRAERETMTRFGGASGVTSTSLKGTQNI
jgi:hypothetical protein